MNRGILELFSKIPRTYELINHILTFGLDSFWRNKAANLLKDINKLRCLDVCSGTGEMASFICRKARNDTLVVALDFCLPMLRKAKFKKEFSRMQLCVAEAGKLPFLDNSFDLITISFATRNINLNREVLSEHFKEFYRILKPAGRFINLETSQPPSKFLRMLFHFYVRLVVMPLGYLLSGSRSAYTYLSYTIPRFFTASQLSGIIYQSGFSKVNLNYLTFGIVAIHEALK